MHNCANCGALLDARESHLAGGGFNCPPRMTAEAGVEPRVFDPMSEVLEPCHQDPEEERRFREFYDKHGDALMEAVKGKLWVVRGMCRAIWSASMQAKR